MRRRERAPHFLHTSAGYVPFNFSSSCAMRRSSSSTRGGSPRNFFQTGMWSRSSLMSLITEEAPFSHTPCDMTRFPPNVEQITVKVESACVWPRVRRNDISMEFPLGFDGAEHLIRLLSRASDDAFATCEKYACKGKCIVAANRQSNTLYFLNQACIAIQASCAASARKLCR